MSDPNHPHPDPARESGPPRWDPIVTALLILLGLPLLLPGVCSYLFTRNDILNPIAALGFLVGAGGLAMIVFGIRRLAVPRTAATAVPAVSERAKRNILLILLAIFVVLALSLTRALQLW